MTAQGFDPIAGAPPSRTEDLRHMREALAIARRGLGRVSPNPLVGAIVARGHQVLGSGWYAEYGGDHAEVVALREAGTRAAGATLYVSLEPCRHTGQTPPCTAAIIRSGVRRVVIACRDPNPEARHGAEELRQAGLDVEIGIEGTAAKRLNAPFLWFHREWVPFASLKLALSLDAKLGAESVRTPVTGIRALDEVHRLRACHDAILIGRNTVAIDDPLLTARGEVPPRVPPVRAVLDTRLRLGLGTQLVRTVEEAPVWVFADAGADGFEERAAPLRDAGVEVIGVPGRDEHTLSVDAVWNEFGTRGVLSVLIEGGGQVAAATLRQGHVQRIHAFLAPMFYGEDGVPAFPGLDPSKPGDWQPVQREALGQDTRVVFEHRRLEEVLSKL
ncbi:bifunctional diaminohydroxyphosphoribosylaminopyrimidine deaminase/5-amino-6-(5-phosphoribosylamino)uracil reductase RibD [Candidatus Palauibacter sp.]|uniref:bifunctional diaminohydroxyphosphoribosylaminopyrimidine deaminase/5-amino-6-(5-phosphoribosylamino)uracil reductase RibD n=1 Tax=Candidatus Palauibacter sp. TaxID=3101350 RepID=UPI003AF25799